MPENLADEMVQGLILGYPHYIARVPDSAIVVHSNKKYGKVALVSGGGSGHEPFHKGA
jgi:dihydroxyacetone kinase-like protein